MQQTFFCTWNAVVYYYIEGHSYYDPARTVGLREGSFNNTISFTDQKTSVDTGSFIPGIYRVNPYSVAHGKVAPSDGSLYVECYDGYYWRTATVEGDYLIGQLHAGLNSSAPSADSLAQQALQKAYAKLGESALSLGEDLGELRETIEMLRNPLGQLKKFLLDDKRRNLNLLRALASKDKRQVNRLLGRTGLASVDAMTGTWLELRYGLRPLVMLAQDVIDMVNEKAYQVWDPNKIRAAKSNATDTVKTYSAFETSIDTIALLKGKRLVEDKVSVFASVQYRQSSSGPLLDQLGLAPQFLPEIAWELTRLSFVVDWFISIGPWLSSLRINPSIEILGSTLGTKVEREVSIANLQARYNWPTGMYSDRTYGSTASYEKYDRVVNPDVSFIPHLTYGRTWDYLKSLDSIALLWSVIH